METTAAVVVTVTPVLQQRRTTHIKSKLNMSGDLGSQCYCSSKNFLQSFDEILAYPVQRMKSMLSPILDFIKPRTDETRSAEESQW